MVIQPTGIKDLPEVLDIYTEAREYQQAHFKKSWPVFPDTFVSAEIRERKHFKMIAEKETIAAVFSIVRSEPVIWNDPDGKMAMYLHRMAVRNAYKGQGIASRIIDWAITTAREEGRKYLRLDTWADNDALRAHYQKLGFRLSGKTQLPLESDLPKHYSGIEVNLFEISI